MKKEWPLSEKSTNLFESFRKGVMTNRQYLSEFLCEPRKLSPDIKDGILIIEAKDIRSIIDMLNYTKNAPDITAVLVNYTDDDFGGSVEDACDLRTAVDLYHAPIKFYNHALASMAISRAYYFSTPKHLRPKIGQVIRLKK